MNRKPLLFSVAVGLSCALLIILSILLQPTSQKSAAQTLDNPRPLVEAALETSGTALESEKPPDSALPGSTSDAEPSIATNLPPQTWVRPADLSPHLSEHDTAKAPPPPARILAEPQSLTLASAPTANTGGGSATVNELTAPPLPSSTPFVVSLNLNQVWGLVGAGSTVTVAVDGAHVGAAVADGIGFFWTTLYDDWGDHIDFAGGESLAIYENGILVAATTLRTITGDIDPLADDVSGVIGGASFPVDVTIYAGLNGAPTVSQTVATDGSGNFTIDLSGTWDFFADESATVAYVENGIEVYTNADAHRLAVLPFPFGAVTAKTTPNAAVTVTVYLADGITMKDQVVDTTNADNGDFWLTPDFAETDIVVVEVEGGIVMSRTVEHFTPHIVDAANDRIIGEAAPGATVRGRANNLTTNGYQHVTNSAVADASGVYTIEFSGLADLMPGNWAGVYTADAEGDELALWAPAQGSVEVNQTYDNVSGNAVAPPGHMANGHLITLTLTSAADGMTYVYEKGASEWGWYDFDPDDGLPDIAPGDVITVESDGFGWQGVVDVMTITAEADTANDRFTGTVEPPSNRVEIWGEQWDGWSNQVLYPVGGILRHVHNGQQPLLRRRRRLRRAQRRRNTRSAIALPTTTSTVSHRWSIMCASGRSTTVSLGP